MFIQVAGIIKSFFIVRNVEIYDMKMIHLKSIVENGEGGVQ